MALADDDSPAFVARAMNAFGSMFIDMPTRSPTAFRGDGALSLGRPPPVPVLGHRVVLPHRLPGRAAELDRRPRRRRRRSCAAGGTRRRRRLRPRRLGRRARPGVPRARTSPGFDFHAPVDRRPPRSGPRRPASSTQTTFEVADAKGYDGTFDLICFFDCLHDMGDPVGIARYARDHLADGRHRAARRAVRARRPRRATSPTTRWPRCSTRRRRASARRTRCRRRSGSASAPRPARPASARCSRQAGFTRRSAGRPRPR